MARSGPQHRHHSILDAALRDRPEQSTRRRSQAARSHRDQIGSQRIGQRGDRRARVADMLVHPGLQAVTIKRLSRGHPREIAAVPVGFLALLRIDEVRDIARATSIER